MIYCCGTWFKPDRVIVLEDNWARKNQIIEIGRCPKYHKDDKPNLIVEYSYYDVEKKRPRNYRPKKDKVQQFLEKIQKNIVFKRIKTGTKSNQAFKYGLNILKKDNKIHQYAVDFNGERTLVKEILL